MDYELIAFLVFLLLVILGPMVLKDRTKRAAFDLVARALERGQALDPDTIMRLTEEKVGAERRRNTLAAGVVLTSLAVGALVSAVIIVTLHADAQLQDFLVPAAMLGAVGVAFLLLAALDRSDAPRR